MSNSLRAIIAAAVMAASVTQAYAARVQPLPVGETLANDRIIPGTVMLPSGTKITTRNGSARIFHENGCTQEVPPYSTEIIEADPVCDTGAVTFPWMAMVGAGVATGVIAYQFTNDNDERMSP
jgi:hypothetical protein